MGCLEGWGMTRPPLKQFGRASNRKDANKGLNRFPSLLFELLDSSISSLTRGGISLSAVLSAVGVSTLLVGGFV
jgi:hypothetical protein